MSGRYISGADIHAQLRQRADSDVADLAEAWIAPDAYFIDIDEIERACPPERIGLSPGAFVALVGPLFGEFE